ncbi:MAG: hypothetical protein A2729_02000 [Candidatus Buchananbacteria bacterium RIFCSPHIGHO2_01_FULL_39_14]|uniref:Uncharacterized protein n=2 Tax=Candidatus Buchananiibacteriota TaxID=1817903 RepID=A0A1G1YTC1_9BACT|nr:MAG: hypothetical protein A2729_02000 [Candidatus Buchananbacteria bacterium RIFCSPHIGHO2_01_FULL_39_14]OGY48090.1 MAG: hypothetical protein A3D39_02260 [Candidatus Buchananbacteria bacterium RIFCSPHIGHO2_02_FULL_39_17]OGY55584.1 MAG: hypothetical protein A2912_02480 [Candidatus Buchananbacteria bacterium RIFCSPLOWO2_01_FULL_40_23b]
MFGRIIFGLIIAAIGAVVTIKAEWIYRNVGPIPSAEKYLGTEGGSRLAYKLIGILVTVVGFLVVTNLVNNVLTAIVRLFIPSIK